MNSLKNDGELVAQFLDSGQEVALEELVQRHGTMVMNVCRRITQNESDAEDATQSVFLILVSKAKELRKYSSIGGWLHQVARYASLNIKKSENRRRLREEKVHMAVELQTMVQNQNQGALEELLDQELTSLSEKYRLPIILHHLEEKTIEEGARILGLNVGTFAARVSRGRALLQKRFARRGMVLSGVSIVSLLGHNASAACSSTLVHSIVQSSVSLGETQAASAELISGSINQLMKETLKIMYIEKLKMSAAVTLIALGIFTGIGLAVHQSFAGTQKENGASGHSEKVSGQTKKTVEPVEDSSTALQQAERNLEMRQVNEGLKTEVTTTAVQSEYSDFFCRFVYISKVEQYDRKLVDDPIIQKYGATMKGLFIYHADVSGLPNQWTSMPKDWMDIPAESIESTLYTNRRMRICEIKKETFTLEIEFSEARGGQGKHSNYFSGDLVFVPITATPENGLYCVIKREGFPAEKSTIHKLMTR